MLASCPPDPPTPPARAGMGPRLLRSFASTGTAPSRASICTSASRADGYAAHACALRCRTRARIWHMRGRRNLSSVAYYITVGCEGTCPRVMDLTVIVIVMPPLPLRESTKTTTWHGAKQRGSTTTWIWTSGALSSHPPYSPHLPPHVPKIVLCARL